MAKNKLAKFADMATYSNVFQYDYETLKREGFPLQGRWSTHFKNDYPITLELGCGKGEYTVGLARKYPGKNFIGIDIKGARMWKGATQALKEKITNATFLRTRVELLNRFFSENEVSEIWITFPDPQMKKVNKRLTSTRFMKEYSRILKPGGIIHLKTDSNFLYQYTLAMIEENGLELLAETDDLYNSDLLDNALSIQTFYEQQWLERGINIKYIRLLCPKEREEEWREPELEIERDDYRSFGRNARV
ncbi:MAG TPA: tRNA (guanosine(46)-N7)-methyltransferase TrmB [Petrimonas sp.]|jgi:tRNA (guanine-N7-)-methyltransferase|nr:tRNA (guanosine(46)-N7)-methyltransferase TrmB [Petrimonas sp.]